MNLEDSMLKSWIYLTGVISKNKITKNLTYNESIVLLFVYDEYEKGEKAISLKDIIDKTKINKSLLNRIIKSLKKKNLVEDKKVEGDGRLSYISLVENNKEDFLKVHRESIRIIREIIDIIGLKNAKSFVESIEKMQKKGFSLNKEKNDKKI
ncbi:MarR family transcriptional regulator [Oceanivirga miroungae]|uniref:HTH marR-type domain-containing protein n=1 Tax=Oceanivirga miroungae TaxID=1130046 RepID=A0A6I8M7L5_9FUSO|nr:helix-turn-helix domain-containing protein [Oceanivirga miroungae]VWL85888.1 hypothetical protein OMES3154_01174 [Oceanivirga miroungae]